MSEPKSLVYMGWRQSDGDKVRWWLQTRLQCFKGQRRDSGSYLKLNCWNINFIYAEHFNLHYLFNLLNRSSWNCFYCHCHLVDIKQRLCTVIVFTDYKVIEKKKPCLESWSFYSNFHDFHTLLIVVITCKLNSVINEQSYVFIIK